MSADTDDLFDPMEPPSDSAEQVADTLVDATQKQLATQGEKEERGDEKEEIHHGYRGPEDIFHLWGVPIGKTQSMATIFDIETGPVDNLDAIMPPFNEDDVKCGRMGPEKKAEKIAQARASYAEDFKSKAALSAETGQVLAIGYKQKGREAFVHGSGKTEAGIMEEYELLVAFWNHFEFCEDQHYMIGFNIFGFDLPFLIRRSWLHGISMPPKVRGHKWSNWLIDLMQRWTFSGYREYVSLNKVARFFNVGGKPDDMSGADFARYYNGTAKEREKAIEYLKNDLDMTLQVAVKMGVI